MREQIEASLAQFRSDISDLDNKALLDRYFYSTSGPVLNNKDQAKLRRLVSDKMDVSVRDVILVGSAKLGFTIRPKQNRPIFSHFGDSSDIDIAIVSGPLFSKYWQLSFQFWTERGDWRKAERFRQYLFRGWLRPDLLPTDPEFELSADWFEFFRSLQASGEFGGYKLAAGIYANEFFWEEYVSTALSDCRQFVEELT